MYGTAKIVLTPCRSNSAGDKWSVSWCVWFFFFFGLFPWDLTVYDRRTGGSEVFISWGTGLEGVG